MFISDTAAQKCPKNYTIIGRGHNMDSCKYIRISYPVM